ncbi:hypothetical protein V8F33_009560 [Rhypophila sp. PSN 637]
MAVVNFTSDRVHGVELMGRNQALVCKPVYSLMNVDVGKQNNDPYRVTPGEKTGTRKFTKLHAWDITQAMLNSYNDEWGITLPDVISTLSIEDMSFPNQGANLDHTNIGQRTCFDYFSTAILALDAASYPSPDYVFNYALLRRSIEAYYQVHGAFLIRQGLMLRTQQPATSSSTSRAVEVRIVVQAVACQVMASVCIASAILLQMATYKASAKRVSLLDDPRTTAGVSIMGQDSIRYWFPGRLGSAAHSVLNSAMFRRKSGMPDTKSPSSSSNRCGKKAATLGIDTFCMDMAAKKTVKQGKMRKQIPLILRTSSRLLLCVLIWGVVTLLKLLLHRSRRENGLGNSRPGTYLQYLWTLLPTLGFSLLGLCFSAIDSELRTLIPYAVLHRGPDTFGRSIGFNCRGILSPTAVYRQLRVKHYAAAMTRLWRVAAVFDDRKPRPARVRVGDLRPRFKLLDS